MTLRPPNPHRRISPRLAVCRSGLTLTELLVVIMIMALLLGAALPVMRMAMEDRAMREASRQLNTYIQLAKAHAAEKGRPVGLWLDTQALVEGIPTNATYCQQLFLAETPPPYSGDFVGATIQVNGTELSPGSGRYRAGALTFSSNFFPLVNQGDGIRFDFKGPVYTIVEVPPDSPAGTITIERQTPYPAPLAGTFQYQVFRSPQKSSVTPMEFSGGAVIDLSASGVGLTGREFATASTPVVIMFSPSGSVDRILGQGMPVIPPSTIHLLVGSLGNMMEAGANSVTYSEVYNRNLEVTANLWVSISHQTGSVVTAQNAWEPRADFPSSLGAAREFAQQGFVVGGR